MVWQADGVKKVKIRTRCLACAMLFFCFVLFARMFYLQVIEAEKYKMLAEKNRIGIQLLPPSRGIIYDRNGIPLARNRKTFRAILTAEDTGGNIQNILKRFQKLVPLSNDEVTRILKEVKRKKSFVPVRIKEDLTFDQIASIELNIPSLPGIAIEESLMRLYPMNEQSAHTVGYVSFLTEDDLRNNELMDKIPDIRIGRIGLEQAFNDNLYGTLGTKKMEINAVGRQVRELDRKDAIPGEDLELSLDSRLQKIGFEALKDEAGSAILMDVNTGEVLMMVSTPSFDPNIFNYPVPSDLWKELNTNERHPLLNKAIVGRYSPGSTFKIVVALAGLEAGVIKPSTEIDCEGKLFVGEHPFHCWKKTGHGALNLQEALQHSCDVYFYEVARRVGIDKIVDMAERLGFGQTTGIGIKNEKSGLLPSRMWKMARYGDAWRLGDTMNLGIGQGFLVTTPIQMVQMLARVVNGGKKVKPTLLKTDKDSIPLFESLDIAPRHIAAVKKGLEAVVNQKGGTAYHTRINVKGQKMGGKTASTQIRRISLAEREEGLKQQHELAWKDRDHAFFLAYAPLDKPRYALVVAVEHGGGGGMVAAPIASTIMRRTLEIEQEDILAKEEKARKLISNVSPKNKPRQ